MRWTKRMSLAAMVALGVWVGGCTTSHGTERDAGEGEPCGPVTCAVGTECCNASCGICVRPGEGCPAIACLDAGPPEPCGEGVCTAGEQCCPGCGPDEGVCVSSGGPCPAILCPPPVDAGAERSCGGWSGETCGPDEVCDYPDGSYCGGDDSLGVCIPRPEACPEPACRPVCGCDRETYCSPCDAHAAGTDVMSDGACPSGDCDAMDAHGEGLCDGYFGVAWDGADCRGVVGCSCVGTDCDALYDSHESCVAAYAGCIDDCRATGCPDGQTCEPCWSSYACLPEGAVC